MDTRSKRASALGIAAAWVLTLPLSDGTVGQPDRQHVAFCYAGIAAAASSEVTVTPDVVIRCRPDVGTILARADVGVIRVRPDVEELDL